MSDCGCDSGGADNGSYGCGSSGGNSCCGDANSCSKGSSCSRSSTSSRGSIGTHDPSTSHNNGQSIYTIPRHDNYDCHNNVHGYSGHYYGPSKRGYSNGKRYAKSKNENVGRSVLSFCVCLIVLMIIFWVIVATT